MRKVVLSWLIVGIFGFIALPWYVLEDGLWNFEWLFEESLLDTDYASGLVQNFVSEKNWLWPIGLLLFAPLFALKQPLNSPAFYNNLIYSGAAGLLFVFGQGFSVGISGWEWQFLENWFGPIDVSQYGLGSGALLVLSCFLFQFTTGLAAKGVMKGDIFVVGAIGFVIASVVVFVFYPVLGILISAFVDENGALAISSFFNRLFAEDIWGVGCIAGAGACGVAVNSLVLSVSAATLSTLFGLAFALVAARTHFIAKKPIRVLSMLPIITPPFVIGLALILLFGRAGVVTQFLDSAFGIEPSRWLYGLPGVLFAQVLAFTPITFMVMIGVVDGISPSMEEASQTLRASRWRTFITITLPLMRPGLAAAFLLAFIESMADFGNPLVLGGNFEVISTKIFFAIVGAQSDQSAAAILAIVLLMFTLSAFFLQRKWLGKKSYTTVTGKGDSGNHSMLPNRVKYTALSIVLPWTAFTIVIYTMVMFGGFVETWGLDHSFTFKHYIEAFSITQGDHGLVFSGAAWNSFSTTISIAMISAPLTAAIGLLVAYLLVRQDFMGKQSFEFGTMLSFAIPGTVIGVSYVLAFNVPPLELTGTGVVLVLCFIFRNMPVGVRGGIAAMSQLDKSLDEASLMLGANSFTTLRRVILPLLKPAIFSSITYGFVRAITSISAVIFLVSADYDMATSYIIGRVEHGDYGIAIAYSSVLIVIMLIVILLMQVLIGNRKLHSQEQV
ncbi:MAG: iron(III) transport system permease protein [Oceanospirillaceae bacterium]|jgi:iron(III) transport system permease protein